MASNRENKYESDKTKARILDLQYYFGKESNDWIDLETKIKEKVNNYWQEKYAKSYSPFLCINCNNYWSYKLLPIKKKKITDYCRKDIFGNIPCERKVCSEC